MANEEERDRRTFRGIYFQETGSGNDIPLDLSKNKPDGAIELKDFLVGVRHITKERFLQSFNHPFLVQSSMGTEIVGKTFFDTAYEDTDKLPIADRQACLVFPIVKRAVNSFSGMITIGRTPNNDFVIPHPLVSKFHAYFRHENGHWKLRDGNSKNRTYIANSMMVPNKDYRVIDKTLVSFSTSVCFLFLEPETFWSCFLEG